MSVINANWIYVVFILGLITGITLTAIIGLSLNEERKVYKVGAWKTPEQLSFAGEKVPLYDIDAKEKYDREILINTYWHSRTLLHIKRSSRWFPIIEPILKKQGIPNDFKYLAVIESGLDLNAVSPAGALGFWQILKSTGKELGLKINKEIDERRHLHKSTLAACKYLHKGYKEFGSWTLAAAAYNAGIPRIKKTLEQQKAFRYYDLYLTTETSRYIYRILALKELLNNMEKYGFQVNNEDLYLPYQCKNIKINGPINSFPDFARKNHTTYKMLKILNPWLMQTYLSNPDSLTYEILLPG